MSLVVEMTSKRYNHTMHSLVIQVACHLWSIVDDFVNHRFLWHATHLNTSIYIVKRVYEQIYKGKIIYIIIQSK